MPSYSYAALTVPVYADTSKLPAQVERDAKAAGEKGGKAAGKHWGANFLSTVGTAIAVVGAEKMFDSMISGAENAERVNKQTEAVIRSTGGAAHVSAGQIQELGNSIMKKTGIDDESIKSGANMLLTFRNVRNEAGKGNDIFNQSTSILTDMTAAMSGGQVTQEGMRHSAIQLGKALNDPIAGMGALSRVGVTFTDQQKAQVKQLVKSGDTMAAQKIILRELNKEFGGSAAAMASPMQKLKTATGELAESMGTALLPALQGLATWLLNTGIPALQSFGGWLGRNKNWLIPLVGAVTSFIGTLYLLSKAFAVARAAAALFGVTLELSLGPISLIIAGCVAIGVGLYLLWTRSRTFRVIVEAVWHGLLVAVQAVVGWFAGPFAHFFGVTIPAIFNGVLTWVKTHWPLIVGFLTGPIGLAVVLVIRNWTTIKNFITNTVNTILTTVRNVWNAITGAIGRALSFIAGLVSRVMNSIRSTVVNIWNAITGAISRAISAIIGIEVRGWSNILGTISRALSAIAGAISRTWANIRNGVASWWGTIFTTIKGWWTKIVNGAASAGTQIISGLKNGIVGGIKGIGSWIKANLVDPIVNSVKHFFGIHSPSTVMAGIGGNLVKGLFVGMVPGISGIGNLVGQIFGGFPQALGGLIAHGLVGIASLPGKALNAIMSLFGGGGNSSRMAAEAAKYAGHKYVWGGPANAQAGFDCSSFVNFIGGTLGVPLPGGFRAPSDQHGPNTGMWLGFGTMKRVTQAMMAMNDLYVNSHHMGIVTGHGTGFAARSTATGTGPQSVGGDYSILRFPGGGVKLPAWLEGIRGKVMGMFGKIGGFFSRLFGGGSSGGQGNPTAGVQQWAGIAMQVLNMFGQGQYLSALLAQMQTESGGNRAAINNWDVNARMGTPSKGLMQVIDPTFNAYAGPFRSRGIWDPLANIYAAVAYALSRYHNLGAVWGHGHGYATGGVVNEMITGWGHRTGQMYHFGERGPELVSPLTGPGATWGKGRETIVINVYPRANQSEVEIAGAVSRALGWAQATGAA